MKSPSSKLFRAVGGAAIAGICAVAVAGCGNDVPSDAVARIGDTIVTKQQFDHWLESAAKGQQQTTGVAAIPDPPDYQRCIESLKETQPEGQDAPDDAELKKQCRQSYNTLKTQVMQFLVQSQWVEQEAEARGVTVSDKEVRQLFEDQKQQAFPNDKDYREFLRESGSTESDILYRVKLDALQNKLTEQVQEEQGQITREDVEEYYEENQERFSQPERRDLNVVLTENRRQAEQAKSELEDGTGFKAVAQEYSIDQASKANGGKLPDVAQGQQDPAFDEAVFDAEPGEIEGPVQTQFGWYVFEVTDVTEAEQQSLEDARETIRGLLASEREQTVLQDFIEDFQEEYKDKTKCREGFVISECSNSPDEETETGPETPAPGGAPQQAPPQGGAPQQAPPPQGGAPQPQQAPQPQGGAPQQQAPPPQ